MKSIMSAMPKHSRLNYIDVVRGIAIMGVMIAHMAPEDSILVHYIRSWNVAIFFILTGILLWHNVSWEKARFSDLCLKKAGSLLYPYITFSLITIVFYFISGDIIDAVKGIIKTVLLDGILALWFLPTLFISEIIFFAFMRTNNAKKIIILVLSLILTSLFSMLFLHEVESRILFYGLRLISVLNRSVIGAIFIIMGYYYEQVIHRINIKNYVYYVSIVVALVANIMLFRLNIADLHFSIIGNPFLYYINAILGSYVLVNISKKLLFDCRLFGFLGKYSLVIFATHLNLKITILSEWVSQFLFEHSYLFINLCIVILIEVVLVLIINRYFPFVLEYKCLCFFQKHRVEDMKSKG